MRKALVDWLQGLPTVLQAEPVTVVLNGAEYEAARYRKQLRPPPGSKSEEPYITDAVYVLGKKPRFQRPNQTCFQVTGDQRDWLVACYWEGGITEFQPFGPNFIIKPWDADGKIDSHEPKEYTRIQIEIREHVLS